MNRSNAARRLQKRWMNRYVEQLTESSRNRWVLSLDLIVERESQFNRACGSEF